MSVEPIQDIQLHFAENVNDAKDKKINILVLAIDSSIKQQQKLQKIL